MDWKIILLFFIGLGQSFIGTLAGSGGLISFPALLLLGVPVHSTIAANKFSNTIGSLSSLIALNRNNAFKLKLLISILPFSLAGGIAGGFIAASISERIMNIIAIALLCFAFALTFLKNNIKKEHTIEKSVPKVLYPGIFGVSVYSGAFGPGQATLLLQLFFRKGLSYLSSVALTRASSFLSSAGAAVLFIWSGYMIWHVAIPLTIGGIVGAQIAVRLVYKFTKRYVQWFLRVITFLLIIQFGYHLF